MPKPRTIAGDLRRLPVSFRPIRREDTAALFQIYASTRQEELRQTDWDARQRETFLVMQFNAQHQYYQEHYPRGSFDLILLDGEPAGRLYVEQRPAEIRIVDITLLPAHRGRGVGSQILAALIELSERRSLPLSIHVEMYNPALALYKRLGFRHIADNGVYYLMERPLPQATPATAEE
ncbi:MAG TPA: GNAT family N-acetyltransferase [Herpetosiphonaceae bacterium]